MTTMTNIAMAAEVSGRDINRKYEKEIGIVSQHIKNDKNVRLTPMQMLYAAICVEGNYSSSTRPVMTKGGKLGAPKMGGMCTISGPHPTPMTHTEIRDLLKGLFAKVKTGMEKAAKDDVRARMILKMVRKKTANTRKIMPGFDPYGVMHHHVSSLTVYLEEAVYPSNQVFPSKLLPFLVVYFDLNAKPTRCNYEILTIPNPTSVDHPIPSLTSEHSEIGETI